METENVELTTTKTVEIVETAETSASDTLEELQSVPVLETPEPMECDTVPVDETTGTDSQQHESVVSPLALDSVASADADVEMEAMSETVAQTATSQEEPARESDTTRDKDSDPVKVQEGKPAADNAENINIEESKNPIAPSCSQVVDVDDNQTDEASQSNILLKADTATPPIEDVDATNKDAPDPAMKDSGCQVDDLPDDADTGGDKENKTDGDRIMLTVKPPGLLMESNFVDVANEEDNMPAETMDFDPIAEEASNDAHETDMFNGKEAETILAEEDDSEQTAETDEAVPEKTDKYVIVHANKTDKSACIICNVEEVPLYLAHKDEASESICAAACLEKFKETHADNYVERILRLRVFATEDTQPESAATVSRAVEEDDADEQDANKNPFRKCAKCKNTIDIDNYVSWEAQDYCNEGCLSDFQRCINTNCAKCQQEVPEHLLGKYCVRFGTTVTQFCKTSCLIAYKKSRKLCQYCQEDLKDAVAATFCSNRCKDTSMPQHSEPKESSLCSVCHQDKQVELKVRDAAKMECICSERCFVAYKFVNKIELVKCEVCPTTFERKPGDASVYELEIVHNLCSKECQKIFLITHRKIVHCTICLVKKYDFDMIRYVEKQHIICVCSLHCLSIHFESDYTQKTKNIEPCMKHLEVIARENDFTYDGKNLQELIEVHINAGKVSIHKIMVTKPRVFPRQKNKAIMCRPRMLTKAIQCKTKERTVFIQTDDANTRWVPIPVPIYVPMPLHMHVQPVPMLTPIPIPLVVPIFILTGRKTMKGIQKEIQKIKSRIPADPLEAEILMMADMAAGVKRTDPSSDSDDDVNDASKMLDTTMATAMDTASTSFSDDVLSMAFKMANEYTEPLDLESEVDNSSRMLSGRRPQMYKPRGRPARMMEMAKPDENMALKYTFGVNAWKQWATMKNHELQKLKSPKFVKLDLLQLSAEDLCFCLCQFVKEVRKPNGSQYASDTIYYLCLGIQLYLYENGRIDNLFCDSYYDKFTETFNDICLSFCQLYNDNQYIVTRVEEEHLWESKQLGAHSPLVLLNTLLFFNTKHFNLTTVEEHLQLSFSHIMKHWKRNANAPNQRNVLLRFYPPQKGSWGKRKVYEQQECLDNPLRCPVRLYEFFLSKCPESVKTRNDVFYLQPERSCVPDSPVWYSTMALDRFHLEKMLNRMKMIKEISMAILGT